MAISAMPSPKHTKTKTNAISPIRFFIMHTRMPDAGRFGKRASAHFRIRALNKQACPLHYSHETAARCPSDDAAQCYPVSAGVSTALYFRAALPPDARGSAALEPDVRCGDATARQHARNAGARRRPGVDPGGDGASGWHFALDSARAGARGTGASGPLQALSHPAHSPVADPAL